MKTIKFLPVLFLLFLVSCSSISVNTDYDKSVNFSEFKTFAYFKPGIDKVKISDFDKKRILYAIDSVMTSKGFTKSETPDFLVNFYTNAEKDISVTPYYAGYGWGYGWGWGWGYPYWGGSYVSTSIQGILTIDIVNAKKNELIWQGTGIGDLSQFPEEKDKVIKDFVSRILAQYPPTPPKAK